MAEPSPVPPTNTFVVRLWQEWSAVGSRWRGRIEHVQSGRGAAFQDVEGLLAFIRSMGPVLDPGPSPRVQECTIVNSHDKED